MKISKSLLINKPNKQRIKESKTRKKNPAIQYQVMRSVRMLNRNQY